MARFYDTAAMLASRNGNAGWGKVELYEFFQNPFL